MSTRGDNRVEAIFRFIALMVAYSLWCTIGLFLWVFLATRVSVAYGASLFAASFSGHNPTVTQDRLSAALHWWVDGMHRIQHANRSGGPPVPSSPFVFWQECAFTLVAILFSALVYLALPASHATYDAVRKRLGSVSPVDVARKASSEVVSNAKKPLRNDDYKSNLPLLKSDKISSSPQPIQDSPPLIQAEATPAQKKNSSAELLRDSNQPSITEAMPLELLGNISNKQSLNQDKDFMSSDTLPTNAYGNLQSSPRSFVEEGVGGIIYDYSPPGISKRDFRMQLINEGIYSATLTSLPETRGAAQKIKEELRLQNIILTIEELAENKPPYLASRASVLYYSDNNKEIANSLALRFSNISGVKFFAAKGATLPPGPHLRFAIQCVPDFKKY